MASDLARTRHCGVADCAPSIIPRYITAFAIRKRKLCVYVCYNNQKLIHIVG